MTPAQDRNKSKYQHRVVGSMMELFSVSREKGKFLQHEGAGQGAGLRLVKTSSKSNNALSKVDLQTRLNQSSPNETGSQEYYRQKKSHAQRYGDLQLPGHFQKLQAF